MTVSSMTVHTSAGDVQLVVEEIAPPAPTQPRGELWYLRSWFEIGKLLSPGDSSNFAALGLFDAAINGTSGQTTWVRCDGEEIELIQRVDHCQLGSDIWHYLVAPQSRIYRTIGGQDPDLPGASINWPRIVLGSKGPGERNMVDVIGKSADGSMTQIAGIPHLSDYSAYSPELQPWLFHRVYCVYGNEVIGDSPKGILSMPIFDAADPGFYVGASQRGMWIPTEFLYGPVQAQPPVPNPYIVHELITLTDPHILVAHLYRIDLTHVTPFVTPALGIKQTPAQFRARYGMDLAINGDQGPWLLGLIMRMLAGKLISTGRWMSKAAWISQSTSESSVWFDQAGNCRISYAKPASFSPYNVISGPKMMLKNGVLQKAAYDDSFIAARSAFGMFDDTRAGVLAVEGQEFTDAGATEQDLARLGTMLTFRDFLELDSGGSTGVDQLNGVSYSVEQRQVLNALCFKGR